MVGIRLQYSDQEAAGSEVREAGMTSNDLISRSEYAHSASNCATQSGSRQGNISSQSEYRQGNMSSRVEYRERNISSQTEYRLENISKQSECGQGSLLSQSEYRRGTQSSKVVSHSGYRHTATTARQSSTFHSQQRMGSSLLSQSEYHADQNSSLLSQSTQGSKVVYQSKYQCSQSSNFLSQADQGPLLLSQADQNSSFLSQSGTLLSQGGQSASLQPQSDPSVTLRSQANQSASVTSRARQNRHYTLLDDRISLSADLGPPIGSRLTGSESLLTGSESLLAGRESPLAGHESLLVGSDRFRTEDLADCSPCRLNNGLVASSLAGLEGNLNRLGPISYSRESLNRLSPIPCSDDERLPMIVVSDTDEGSEGVGSSRENGHQGGSMRRSFSKSATDLMHRTRSASGERGTDVSPQGSPPLDPRRPEERARANTQPRPAPSFFTTLRTKFQRTLSKEKTVVRRKDVLLDGVRSNSHPDVSVERQDSTTDYAADNSSAEQSSSGTPLTTSPRRIPFLSHRQQSQG